jgi:hypothetical protein
MQTFNKWWHIIFLVMLPLILLNGCNYHNATSNANETAVNHDDNNIDIATLNSLYILSSHKNNSGVKFDPSHVTAGIIAK